jgi:hypothetical protein
MLRMDVLAKRKTLFFLLAIFGFICLPIPVIIGPSGALVVVSDNGYVASTTRYYIDVEVENFGSQPQGSLTVTATFYNSNGDIIGTGINSDLNVIEPYGVRVLLVIYIDTQQSISQIDHYSLSTSSSTVSSLMSAPK